MKRKIPKSISTILLIIGLVLTSAGLFAQKTQISGTVTAAEDGSAIPGVNVVIKGTNAGTITNLDGQYTIDAKPGDILAFSFIGYLAEDIEITEATSVVDVKLSPDLIGVDEVVVIGYGTQKKSDLTGAVSTVSNDEITRKPVATIEQSLQGLSPGVSVTSNSGAPGSGAIVRIRGVGSLNSTTPLYVIDGVPVGGPNSTDPRDIESINILKDAAACAIYGSRGANGVVVITTKKGKAGKPRIEFEAYYGLQKAWKTMDLLGSEEYSKYVNEVNYNAGGTGPRAATDPFNQQYDTDWQDEMFRNAPISKYHLSYSGGSEDASYSVSGGYFSQEGIMIGTGFEKYNIRVNSQATKGRFKFGESITLVSSYTDNEKNTVGGRSQIERTLKMTPNIPVYDTNYIGGYGGPTSAHNHDAVNPVGVANLYEDNQTVYGTLGNVFGELEIIKGLKYKLNMGWDVYVNNKHFYEPIMQLGGSHVTDVAKLSNRREFNKYFLIENTLTYDRTFDKHHITLLGGYTQEKSSWEYLQVTAEGFPTNDQLTVGAGENKIGDGQKYESGLVSYLGRLNYAFASKYLFQANFRRDASSKFSSSNRWGFFPSFSAGWVVSKENFMLGIDKVSFLKFRGSWGQLGNQAIGDYNYEANLNFYQNYTLGGNVVNGIGPRRYPNEDVKWETTTQSNVALDLGLFENSLNISAEYYKSKTTDMLIPVTMPTSNGSIDFPYQNAGSVENSGIELSLSYKKFTGDFHYAITGNLTTINNEIVEVDQPIFAGNSELDEVTKSDVGQPIGSFFGFLTDGIYQSQEEIDAMNKVDEAGNPIVFAPRAAPGDIRYVDLNNDGKLSDEDKDYLGSPIPTLIYGLNFSADYRDFDLSLTFQGAYGNKIFRETMIWTEGMYSNFNASEDVNDRWRGEDVTITTVTEDGKSVSVDYTQNLSNDMPRAIARDPNKNATRFSDRFVESGSYLRLKDLTIGYTLPTSFTERFKISNARLYVQFQNLLTFTKYTGYDPEIGSNALNTGGSINTSRGIDNGYFPQARTFLGGIQLSF